MSPRPSGAPGHAISAPMRRVMVGLEESEADRIEEFVRPALLMREIAELARRRAGRADQRSGGAKRQEIGEIEEMPGLGDRLGPGAGEPGELGRVHLGRDPAAHIAQHRVGAGVDPLRVACGAMIHPHDHVALGRVGRAHRQGTRIAVERDQRAGRVEAHAANSLGLKPRRLDRLTHRRRRRAPDVVGRLLDDLARLAPDGDRAPRAGDERAGGIEHAGPGAERADVHSDKRLAHTLLPDRLAHDRLAHILLSSVKSGRRIVRFEPRWQGGALKPGRAAAQRNR